MIFYNLLHSTWTFNSQLALYMYSLLLLLLLLLSVLYFFFHSLLSFWLRCLAWAIDFYPRCIHTIHIIVYGAPFFKMFQLWWCDFTIASNSHKPISYTHTHTRRGRKRRRNTQTNASQLKWKHLFFVCNYWFMLCLNCKCIWRNKCEHHQWQWNHFDFGKWMKEEKRMSKVNERERDSKNSHTMPIMIRVRCRIETMQKQSTLFTLYLYLPFFVCVCRRPASGPNNLCASMQIYWKYQCCRNIQLS